MNNIKLCSGIGRHHTDRNRPLSTVEWDDITALVDNPQDVEKHHAQWFIPSTLLVRAKERQEAGGEFWALWLDIDDAPPAISVVADFIDGVTGGCRYEVYTSKSATIETPKSRVLIPLAKALTPSQYRACIEGLNDKLEGAGTKPDRSNEGISQLLFLPNEGEHYESQSNRTGPYFDPLEAFSDAIAAKQEAIKVQESAITERIKNAQLKRSERLAHGFKSPIDAFNAAYVVEEILTQSGYEQRGHKFRHPNSESGSFSASVKDRRVHTLSSADLLWTGGGGGGAHDAFSAFTVLWHNGDRNLAIKDACNNWLNGWNEEKEMRGNLEGFEVMASQIRNHPDQLLMSTPAPRYNLAPPPIKTPFKLTSIRELMKQPPILKWLIKGYLLPEGLGFLNGDPATGKSFLALDWYCHIACGIPWRGNPVKQGGIVVIAGEGHFGLRRRLKAWSIHKGIDLSDKPIVVSDLGASLTDKQSVEAVNEAIDVFVEDHGELSLIIIDTLHRNFGAADENSSEDMAVYFNNLDALRDKHKCIILAMVIKAGHVDLAQSGRLSILNIKSASPMMCRKSLVKK
jgi:hypothetical protein